MQKLQNAFKVRLGMLRSIAAYYWKPFNLRRLKSFYRQFMTKGDLCFDIGAHIGNRTNAWHHLGATVVAVEPQDRCLKYMRRKFKGKDNIIILDKGVGAEKGVLTMNISLVTPTVSTFADDQWQEIIDKDTSFKVKWEETKEVEITTLDAMIKEYGLPRFCKIDVENYEVEVLKGLSVPLPAVSIEYYPKTLDQAMECIDLLEGLGTYEYNWSTGETQAFEVDNWITAEDLKAVFRAYDTNGKFGDFYARLIQ
ncbi:MAG: FkbM family methyltransferase [Bacteroidota bacterium]